MSSPRTPRHRRSSRAAAFGLAVVGAVSACSFGPSDLDYRDARKRVVVAVRDESGAPVAGAIYDHDGVTVEADRQGRIQLRLNQPIAGVVSAPGMLPEPLVVDPDDGQLGVRMLAREGEGGPRVALHFGGDVMLGRRYQGPIREGTAQANDAEQARAVVSALAPIAAAADATIVNAETVIGDLPPDTGLIAKRFVIQSPPQVVDALQELGVDAVTLGNNHAHDHGELGILSTLALLEPPSITAAGAGVTADDAVRGVLLGVGQQSVGLVSATTVNGDFVNDQLPLGGEASVDLPLAERWQYEQRPFGFGEPGDPAYIEPGERSAGAAWQAFRALEPGLGEPQVAELWAALTALDAYPELQDWVARRGHGGAAAYEQAAVAEEIARLRGEGATVVVVQFHAGFQFSERPGSGVVAMSRDAIDAGADIVVSHHPHVLQGFEWYRGRLIAYSLGNLVFDQDFLSTYPSALLRVVLEGDRLLEARAIPLALVDYRPLPVTGSAAERVVRLLDARSQLPGISDRVDGLRVGVVLDAEPGTRAGRERLANVVPATVELDRNTGLITTAETRGRSMPVSLLAGEPLALPPCLSLLSDSLQLDDIEYGVDLFTWGAMDDVTADQQRERPVQWVTRTRSTGDEMVRGPSEDDTDDALHVAAASNLDAFTRFVSRAQIRPHRWFTSERVGVDKPPSYELRLDVWRTRGRDAVVRLDVYNVEDVDPIADPVSVLIRQVQLPIPVFDERSWTTVSVPIPDDAFAPGAGGISADAVLVTLQTPEALDQRFAFDNVQLLEWRAPPDPTWSLWLEADAVRSARSQRALFTAAGCAPG